MLGIGMNESPLLHRTARLDWMGCVDVHGRVIIISSVICELHHSLMSVYGTALLNSLGIGRWRLLL